MSNVLLVVALDAGKDWLLAANAGVFWVLMRMLACGGLGVVVWEGMTGTLGKKKFIEVRYQFIREIHFIEGQFSGAC